MFMYVGTLTKEISEIQNFGSVLFFGNRTNKGLIGNYSLPQPWFYINPQSSHVLRST